MEMILGLGGNIGNVLGAFETAIQTLEKVSWIRILGTAGVYQSKAVGPVQPDYLNSALHLRLDRHPLELLRLCMSMEIEAGRNRTRETRWGPRPLDLDLLITDGFVFRGSDLVLPHPRFHERIFALRPAVDLVPGWIHPVFGSRLEDLVTRCPEKIREIRGVKRILRCTQLP